MNVEVLTRLDAVRPSHRGGAVAVGNFDGVHRGHQRIVATLVQQARRVGGPAVVFSFDPHPAQLLRPQQAPPPLCWPQRKAQLLGQAGAQVVVLYPTDEELLALEPEAFFQRIVVESLGARAMVQGGNFRFGRGRKGDVHLLERLCRQHQVELKIIDEVRVEHLVVSSSLVRRLLQQGNVALAARCLGRPHRIRGQVVAGERRGATLGFPTANLERIPVLVPAPGVYAAWAYGPRGHWPAAVNVGANPTFGQQRFKVEAHLIGFRGELYGQMVELDFVEWLREVQTFPEAQALARQLAQDVQRARELLRRSPWRPQSAGSPDRQ